MELDVKTQWIAGSGRPDCHMASLLVVKKEPNVEKALSLQDEISEAEGKFKQKMIGHLLRMKKINREAEIE